MRETKWDILVVGGANTDYLVRGDNLPKPGQTAEGEEFQEAAGGKGVNQAVAASRLGARVVLVACVGRDERGDRLLARLAEEGVDTRYVVRDENAYTGVALIQVERRGEKQILTAPGANRRVSIADVHAAAAAFTSARALLTQLEAPLETIRTAVQMGREAGLRVFLDPGPAVPLPDELLRLIDVIKPNSSEAETLTGVRVKDRASAREAAQQLLERGVGIVAVQAGNEGNLVAWKDGECFLPRIPVESVDATGAGDSFAAAMAVALLEGRALPEAACFANAAAALATTVLGAQPSLPKRKSVLELLAATAS